MTHAINHPILLDIGLTEGEAYLYELLVEHGTTKASDLVEQSNLGRGNVYNILNSLIAKHLVILIQGAQQRYEAVDPSALRGLLVQRVNEARLIEQTFENDLPSMQSAFRLSTGRPTVEYFEGVDGMKIALYETLKSKTEILTYVDVHSLGDDLGEVNRRYVTERVKKGIEKRIIVADTPEARAFFEEQRSAHTTVAFVKDFPARAQTAIEIYDGAVAYFTLSEQKKIAVVMRDPSIYQTHRQQFEYVWSQAKLVKRLSEQS
jgi:sugar-specific transcriptional regulator TrmB